MPAERARAPRDEEEEGYEPSFSSAVVGTARRGGSTSVVEDVGEPAPNAGLGASVMIGTHFHSLDEKGRVIVPAKMRNALTEQFWMMLDENDNIGLYPYATGMDILEHCERMIRDDPDNEETAAAVLRITEAADLVTVESAFRVPIPDLLRFRAQLIKEVVTVGVLNHAVLWARERWEDEHAAQPITVEVRKKQASLMRAAASGARQRAESDDATRRAEEEARELAREQALERAYERDAERAAGITTGTAGALGAGRNAGRKAASSSDGGRGAGVLKMSDLGR